MSNRHADHEHTSPHVAQRDYPSDSEGPLEPPERDGREQVIYEHTAPTPRENKDNQ